MIRSLLLLVGVAVAATIALLLRRAHLRRYGPRQAGDFLPESAPKPDGTARIAEALVLAGIGAVMLAMKATNPATGGLLTMLGELHPAFATTNVILAVLAAAGVLVAVVAALAGRTIAGVLILAGVLLGYGLVLNGPFHLLGRLSPDDTAAPVVRYAIRPSGGNLVGAELWVNNVYLGKTPVVTTRDEFLAKVPFWPSIPQEFSPETSRVLVTKYSEQGTWSSAYYTWAKFGVPDPPRFSYGPRRRMEEPRREWPVYYARVRLGDEWGLAQGSGGSGGGGGRYTYQADSHFEVMFPQREKRLETLLNQARLADYCPGADWFKALETYGEDGWIALRKAADTEPEMMRVLDAWAAWRYGLDDVTDADSAWKTFRQICDEADARQCYFTPSVAGRAVELLVPRLDPERLVCAAETIIASAGNYGWMVWRMNGRLQFGMTHRPEGFDSGAGAMTNQWVGTSKRARFPVRGYAVAHAVWMLDRQLEAAGAAHPNLVERRITPALLCRHWDDRTETVFQLAGALGGPDLDRFLLRQDWRTPVGPAGSASRRELVMMLGGGHYVNRWLYLLANLNDPAGREFRATHEDRLVELADAIHVSVIEDSGLAPHNLFDFLFLDLERGEQSLAVRYWPKFCARTTELEDRGILLRWRYLIRMGPASTPAMFVESYRMARTEESSTLEALRLLSALPPAQRAEVAEALKQAGEAGPAKYPSVDLDSLALADPEQSRTDKLLAELQAANSGKRRGDVAAWLEHARPDHPLVERLAKAEDPALRVLALGALQARPTPAHRWLLKRLAADLDETVRAAARQAEAALAKLAAAPPGDFGSPGYSSAVLK